MIGLFLINKQGRLAFAQFGAHVKIEAFRYVPDVKLCLVQHSGGTEELFTTEQPPEIAQKLESIGEILVAHIDEDGGTKDEYVVPISN